MDVDVDVEALLDEAAPEDDDELAEPDEDAAALAEAVDAVLCGAILLDTLVIAIDRFP